MPATRQITLFKFKPGVPPQKQEEIFNQLKRLHLDIGIDVEHKVCWALERRKVDFMQETIFPPESMTDQPAPTRSDIWQNHPAHNAIVAELRANADWWSGNFSDD